MQIGGGGMPKRGSGTTFRPVHAELNHCGRVITNAPLANNDDNSKPAHQWRAAAAV